MGVGGIVKWGLQNLIETNFIRENILKKLDIYDEFCYFTQLVGKVTSFTSNIQYYTVLVQLIYGFLYFIFLGLLFLFVQFEDYSFLKKLFFFNIGTFLILVLDVYSTYHAIRSYIKSLDIKGEISKGKGVLRFLKELVDRHNEVESDEDINKKEMKNKSE